MGLLIAIVLLLWAANNKNSASTPATNLYPIAGAGDPVIQGVITPNVLPGVDTGATSVQGALDIGYPPAPPKLVPMRGYFIV